MYRSNIGPMVMMTEEHGIHGEMTEIVMMRMVRAGMPGLICQDSPQA